MGEHTTNGGVARARSLSPMRRREIAQKAAQVRWIENGSLAIAKWGSADKPLRIGEVEIPCYVLADGRRVLAQRGLQGGLGLAENNGAARLALFLATLERKGIDIKGLTVQLNNPIRFVPPHGGKPAHGHEATILPTLCSVILKAGRQGKLHQQQEKLVERCALLQDGFATVGILALVDEATGYQAARERDELKQCLEAYIAKELRPWMKTFPDKYYEQIYRLRGWGPVDRDNHPQAVGGYTNDIIYSRLAPGVLEELKRVTPKGPAGKPKARFFQSLTEEFGHPKLRMHLKDIIVLMEAALTWDDFMDMLNRARPKYSQILREHPEMLLNSYKGPK